MKPATGKSFLIFLLCFMAMPMLHAQDTTAAMQAQQYTDLKQYDKAIDIYKKLYAQQPADGNLYNNYLAALLAVKDYKAAEKLALDQLNVRQQSPAALISLGSVYEAAGKSKKATEQYDKALTYVNGDDLLTQQLASSFTTIGKDDYAIKTYEAAVAIIKNPYLYSGPMSKLYLKKGEPDKAINVILDAAPGQPNGVEDTKAQLLDVLGTDAARQTAAQKIIIKKINGAPENPYFADLLTWLYTQKNDWDGALLQMEALDARNKETGQRLLDFARLAEKEKQYDIAIKALDDVAEKGKDQPLYTMARAARLSTGMQRLAGNPAYTPADVALLEKEYEDFFTAFPQYYATQTLQDYAMLEAQYANNPAYAEALLRKALAQPNVTRRFAGDTKLQLGDYEALQGKVWDASLTYSQVDKDFKEDALGEEGRFRNARLAYYRGDFTWAQGQLSVLKASTSELIANDALYLSVLITENVPPDSNLVPLQRFAAADLLLFQNKDKEAGTLLDSIAKAYPKHPLNDDILLLHSKIEEKHHNYTAALAYLAQIMDRYKEDVLADDAVYRTAVIYDEDLHQPEQAKKYYEQLVIDYPGSTYVQSARQALARLVAAGANTP